MNGGADVRRRAAPLVVFSHVSNKYFFSRKSKTQKSNVCSCAACSSAFHLRGRRVNQFQRAEGAVALHCV